MKEKLQALLREKKQPLLLTAIALVLLAVCAVGIAMRVSAPARTTATEPAASGATNLIWWADPDADPYSTDHAPSEPDAPGADDPTASDAPSGTHTTTPSDAHNTTAPTGAVVPSDTSEPPVLSSDPTNPSGDDRPVNSDPTGTPPATEPTPATTGQQSATEPSAPPVRPSDHPTEPTPAPTEPQPTLPSTGRGTRGSAPAGADAVLLLDGSAITCDSGAVSISGSTATVTAGGTYVATGNLTDGMIIIDAPETDAVTLYLNGVDINKNTSAAVYVRSAAHLILSVAAGSVNYLTTAGNYANIDQNNIDAAVFSKSDLTLSGEGTIYITAGAGHGVVSKDALDLSVQKSTVESTLRGYSAQTALHVSAGNHTIKSGRDGLRTESLTDRTAGAIEITGAQTALHIVSGGDGVSAQTTLRITDARLTIITAGGYENKVENTLSAKGLKSAGAMTLSPAECRISAADDAVHSDTSMAITGGSYELYSARNALQAGTAFHMSDGRVIGWSSSPLNFKAGSTVRGGVLLLAGKKTPAAIANSVSGKFDEQSAGTKIICTAGGQTYEFAPGAPYSALLIAGGAFRSGETCTVTVGGTSYQMTVK